MDTPTRYPRKSFHISDLPTPRSPLPADFYMSHGPNINYTLYKAGHCNYSGCNLRTSLKTTYIGDCSTSSKLNSIDSWKSKYTHRDREPKVSSFKPWDKHEVRVSSFKPDDRTETADTSARDSAQLHFSTPENKKSIEQLAEENEKLKRKLANYENDENVNKDGSSNTICSLSDTLGTPPKPDNPSIKQLDQITETKGKSNEYEILNIQHEMLKQRYESLKFQYNTRTSSFYEVQHKFFELENQIDSLQDVDLKSSLAEFNIKSMYSASKGENNEPQLTTNVNAINFIE